MARKIMIDTDPGVDDAMAILLALASPELDVVGLTTIFGNAATSVTTTNALVILDVADRFDIPVAAGMTEPTSSAYLGPVLQVHGNNGLGDTPIAASERSPLPTSAAEFLFETAAADPGNVTLLTLGPLTNVAAALRERPELVGLVQEVVVMGGNALVPGNATPSAEANINNDPEAADLVFGAEWSVTMVGLDVTHQITLSGAAIDRISAGSGPTAEFLAGAIPLYRDFFETTNGIDGIFLHDPSTVAYLLDPEAFSTNAWAIRVETESFSRGKTWPNLGNTDEAAPPAWQGRPMVNVCTGVDGARVSALVEGERWWIEIVDRAAAAAGFSTFLPHRDNPDKTADNIDEIFQNDKAALERCDVVVASLNGVATDDGTAWELGFSYALGKYQIGVYTDWRARFADEVVNLMIGESVDVLASSLDEMTNALLAWRTEAGGPSISS